MSRRLYTLLLRCALPFAALWYAFKGWRRPAYRIGLRDRLGRGLARHDESPLWLHAASVGEVQALAGLLQLLVEQGAAPLLLTVGTATGLAHARALYAQWFTARGAGSSLTLSLLPAPWDLPGAARRFLQAVRPRAAVLVETELWPNLIAALRERNIPLALVSARVSPRSLRRYQRFAPALMRDTVRAFDLIAVQSDADRERFLKLGADPARLQVLGNLKFDFLLPPDLPLQGQTLRARLPPRWVWVAGSTHAGEESACVTAQRRLMARAGARGAVPLLLLAPRHPERFADVARWLDAQRVPYLRYSQWLAATAGIQGDTAVLVVDVMGELLRCYAAADAAFVGGSLVKVGGHNLLEPAMLAKPVLSGPCQFNAPDVARLLRDAGALRTVRSSGELAQALWELLSDPAQATTAGERAADAVAASRGTAARTLVALNSVLVRPVLPRA